MRIFLLTFLCCWLCACGGSNNSDSQVSAPPATLNYDLSPSNLTLDPPPTDGKLPSDLIPPAE
jgi:hypothetical protein